ncbi:carbohydrate kinase family protein [Alysiella filiformis]|uniref:Fructokinase n=1 Tax=Alysiella filiformis DSM 16848 TaxID=1120981 RepID=A0A286EGN2_9NEIS|nr:carbohydrate kinase [Alysiella filiformis]QMT32156.1 carbohydrate kinase [Alysiella filiformis]UBQ56924.1 carbohydrate kinase [Alysiella filiformis DSM 16848]SOD70090.1 fructokinase [Alysiella filiformis DSM 16848]
MKISSFGEVLWDDFATGKVLGGAPLNVMVRLSNLGADTAIISRCGQDADGEALLQQVAAKNVATHLIQIDPQHATSLVKVSLDSKGVASYDIVYPCAWDKIALQADAIERVQQSDAFVFGSLSARDEVSRQTLNALLPHAKYKIFDVNLRAPHYNLAHIVDLMKQADLIKLNDDELQEIATFLGSKYHSIEQNMRLIAELTQTAQICVTLGSHGAVLWQDGTFHHHSGFRVAVADTVGAGDSFLGGLIFQLLHRTEPAAALQFACALGALVAAEHGATPNISLAQIESFINP